MDLIEAAHFHAHRHPWELARADAVAGLVGDVRGLRGIADVGAGDMFFAERIAAASDGDVLAIDPGYEDDGCRGRVRALRDVASVADDSLELVFLLDVLEHIEGDAAFLATVARKVRAGGRIVATVPAFQRLFSEHDLMLRHHRRYSLRRLCALGDGARLERVEALYFYSALFLARVAQMALKAVAGVVTGKKTVTAWPFPEAHPLTRLVRAALNLDFRLNRRLARLALSRFGLSACVVWRKGAA
jgi:2-polyprenyl-3-methyl-5-hydroxy-6-metoxy-1,4-benzoquinol methylase